MIMLDFSETLSAGYIDTSVGASGEFFLNESLEHSADLFKNVDSFMNRTSVTESFIHQCVQKYLLLRNETSVL